MSSAEDLLAEYVETRSKESLDLLRKRPKFEVACVLVSRTWDEEGFVDLVARACLISDEELQGAGVFVARATERLRTCVPVQQGTDEQVVRVGEGGSENLQQPASKTANEMLEEIQAAGAVLSLREKRFCRWLHKGLTQREASLKAAYGSTATNRNSAADERARQWMAKDTVKRYLALLREHSDMVANITREVQVKNVAEMAFDASAERKDKIAAAKLLSKMTGALEPQKVEISGTDGGPVELAAVPARERLARLARASQEKEED